MTDDLLVLLRRAGDVLDDVNPAAEAPAAVLVLENARRPFRPLSVAAVALAAAVLAGGISWAATRTEPEAQLAARTSEPAPEHAAEVPAAARVLPTLEGWAMHDVQLVDDTSGSVTFHRGHRSASLRWEPRDIPEIDGSAVEVAGYPALLGSYNADDHVAGWRLGAIMVTVRGDGTRDDFEALLRSLRPVDMATWKSALPQAR